MAVRTRDPNIQIRESNLVLSDVTTDDVSIAAHGFAPKLPNDATKYLDGTGTYSVPAGGGGGSGIVSFIRKSSDQSKTTDTTLADDSQLLVAIGATETKLIHAVIDITVASAAPDIKFTWLGPTGSTGYWIEIFNLFDKQALGVSSLLGLTTTGQFVFDVICHTTGTSGNISFQWAQNSSSADATTVKANSFMTITGP